MRRLRARVLGPAALLLAAGLAGPTRAEEAGCQQWNLEVACSTSAPRVMLGEAFTATVLARNTGDTALTNVTLRLRGDQGAPCVSGPATGVTLLVERLEPGQSRELSARFQPEGLGLARVLGSARDSLGWASGNCACTVEVLGLAALQTDLVDRALDGSERGIFQVGEEFLYEFSVQNDAGNIATPDLKVSLALPGELQFVSGQTDGATTVAGQGQAAETAPFVLAPPSGSLRVTFRVKVLSVPPTHLVKTKVTVTSATGFPLASETESTTVK